MSQLNHIIITMLIYGPVRQGSEWRIRNTEEINNIIKKDLVRFVNARRRSWIGHVKRMENSRMPKTVMRKKSYTRIKRGRPKVRWLDDVQVDLREMGIEGWRRKTQDRDQWRRIAQENSGQDQWKRIAQENSGQDQWRRIA
jgi:hypothetical protein